MATLAETNKNPLNLRVLPNGEKWQGQTGVSYNSVTGKFCIFESNAKGVRAAVINMRSYVKFSGVKTLRDVIYRWAPPPEGGIQGTVGSAVGGVDQNHTEAYLASVCEETGLPQDWSVTPLTLPSTMEMWRGQLASVIRAMNRVEAGKSTITIEETMEGIHEALNVPKGYVRQDDGNIIREDMSKSETIKITNQGQLTNVIGTGTSAVSAFALIQDYRVAAIVAAIILVVGAGVAIYFLRLRKDRQAMNEKGIA